MNKEYQDKWKRFMHRALKNLDFSAGISSRIVTEITYTCETLTINPNKYLFQAGDI